MTPMLGWALRCLFVTLVIGGAFIGMQQGGLIGGLVGGLKERVLTAAGPERALPQSLPYDDTAGARLEEVVMLGRNGHFVTDVYINGTAVTFLIDTGASHTVLNQRDAERLRLNGGRLRYSVPFQSANGTTYAAPVSLRDVRLGQFQVYDLEAYVNQGNLGISLLGMSFLRRFESYEFLQDRLILRW